MTGETDIDTNNRDVHVMPCFKGEPEHASSPDCWCEPELKEDYTDQGGSKLYVHRRPE